MQGAIVALQEMHWSPGSAALWWGLFPGATVSHTDTEEDDPTRRHEGGVAVVAPQPFELVASCVLAPGYGLSASFTHPGLDETVHIHNMYLPPDASVATARAICDAMAAAEPAPGLHFMTGDFNAQVGAPRSRDEEDVKNILSEAPLRLQLHWTTEHVASRRGRHHTQLDGIAAPNALGAHWQAQARWMPGLSDHAALVGTLRPAAGLAGRRCTPGAIATLPPEASADLRRQFCTLHYALGVPCAAADDTVFPPPPAVPGDPIADGQDAGTAPGPAEAPAPADPVIPNVALAAHGRALMNATIHG